MGLGLSAEDVAALEERTEGWIAGLQLAALSMRGAQDTAGVIQTFSGSHRYVVDYLAQEILSRQTQDVQEFLLHTSILDRLSGPLCGAVSGCADCQSILEYLEKAHLFIVPLDQERRWYRYHHLFAEFLRARLEHQEPAAVADLERRASEWFAHNHFMAEAIEHAFAAGDPELAATLIDEESQDMFARSELVTLRQWLERLPAAALNAHPRLAMAYAWASLATGHSEDVEQQLQAVERSHAAVDPGTRAEVAVVRGSLLAGLSDIAGSAQQAQEALRLLDSEHEGLWSNAQSLRGVAAFSLAVAYEVSGQAVAASEAYSEAARLNLAAHNPHLAPMCISKLAQAQELRGQLRQAATSYRHALKVGKEMNARLTPLVASAYSGLGLIQCEWNDLAAAEKNLQAGIDLGKEWQLWEAIFAGYAGLARSALPRAI